jgi:alpha-galactosidase
MRLNEAPVFGHQSARPIRLVVLPLLFGFTLLSAAFAPAELTGFWVLRVPTGDGNDRETFFQLNQAGESVTGRVLLGSRELPIHDGTFRDGHLHFVVSMRRQNQERHVSYDGALEGSRILLTQNFPGREPVKGTAERARPEAALPPPRLPIPALHDVPDNGLARTPPMGWNSWNKFAGKVDDAAVRGVADAMVSSGMSKAGYVYVNIDDTWEGSRDRDGNVTTNRKFPDMKALADYVHSKGLKIGIYLLPRPEDLRWL